MLKRTLVPVALLGFMMATQACSGSGQPELGAAPQASVPAPQASVPTPQASVPAPAESPAPPKPRPAPPVQTTAPAPTATPAPPPVTAPAPPPGEMIQVGAARPGLIRVGPDKCRMCHRVQHESWSASRHASLTPPLDCESCHGPGSEYKSIPVMKDLAKAREAGLVIPAASFCTGNCHRKGWNDEMPARVHAHKAK